MLWKLLSKHIFSLERPEIHLFSPLWPDLILGSHRTPETPNPSLLNYTVYFLILAVEHF